MTWKNINNAPRDGTWLDLGHTDFNFVERGRWGVHRNTGEPRWVDGNGHGLFDATHWDFPRVPPKAKTMPANAPIGVDDNRDRWHVEYNDNGESYSIYDRNESRRKV